MEALRRESCDLFFADEMRYGLISNLRRSWSKVGARTAVDTQQVFEDRYLFSAVSPLSGDSFHLTSIEGFDSQAAQVFLRELKKRHPDKMVIVVWDNAPCHRPRIHREIPGLRVLFLPPYSPELNPAERLFEELRRSTANRMFKTLGEQEACLEERLVALIRDKNALRRLTGYAWIRRQCSIVN